MPMPEEYSHCVCCFVILVDFVFKVCKKYYLQVFVEVCKYEVKKLLWILILLQKNQINNSCQ